MGKGSVHITEEDNWDEPGSAGELFYAGTFYGHHDGARGGAEFEGLPIDEAIAWGRARADRVYVRLGDDDVIYAAGAESSKLPRWPPPDLPELVRRRPAGERWKDRTDADDPIAWSVEVMLEPSHLTVTDPGRVEAIARAAGADGHTDCASPSPPRPASAPRRRRWAAARCRTAGRRTRRRSRASCPSARSPAASPRPCCRCWGRRWR